MKTGLIVLMLKLVLVVAHIGTAQRIESEGFVRLPQVVNIPLRGTVTYTPVTSTGITLRYRGAFADGGALVTAGDALGCYTYFGSALSMRMLDEQWTLVNNWFGEVTWLPGRGEQANSTVYTAGVSPVLVHQTAWGSLALAITAGVATTGNDLCVNTRVVINCSIPFLR